MLFFRVTPTGGNGDGDNYLDITGTLAAGETEITLTDSHIETDGIYDFYTSKYGVVPTDVEIAAGSVTLTFDAQSENIIVMVRKWGESGSGLSWDYSTTAVDTGQKWIDGKPIMCKVIHLSTPQASNPSNWYEIQTDTSDIDDLIFAWTKGGGENSGYNTLITCMSIGFTTGKVSYRVERIVNITDIVIFYTQVTS